MNKSQTEGQTALVIGAGPGLGAALGHCFHAAGMNVGLSARNEDRLKNTMEEFAGSDRLVCAYPCDACDEAAVKNMFTKFKEELGPPDLVVFNAGVFVPGKILDITAQDFTRCWEISCLGGFITGREASGRMLEQGHGTILFTGATASLRGSAGFANLAVGKFGLRALAQSMARELGPKGIHVGHVIIDGIIQSRTEKEADGIPANEQLSADDIAMNYLHLHCQPRSAWSHELDLRPWTEKF